MTGGPFRCPECGKLANTAQGLGAHRARAHGVAGYRRAGRRQTAPTPAVRDRLLTALYSTDQRIPPRTDVLARLATWLDEGEALASLKP